MSDDSLILVPRDPTLIPTSAVQVKVSQILRRLMPGAESISSAVLEAIGFFDAGENFEQIACPHCSSPIAMAWWQDRMDEDSSGGRFFSLASHELPCCSGSATLNDLVYDWPQAFGRFAWTVRNPGIGSLAEVDKTALEASADTALVVVRQHS